MSSIERELSIDLDVGGIGPEVATGLGEIAGCVEQTGRVGEVDIGAGAGRADGDLSSIEYGDFSGRLDRALRRIANGQAASVGNRKISSNNVELIADTQHAGFGEG